VATFITQPAKGGEIRADHFREKLIHLFFACFRTSSNVWLIQFDFLCPKSIILTVDYGRHRDDSKHGVNCGTYAVIGQLYKI
jgi:hypothetical protein